MAPRFLMLAVVSSDGYIARSQGDPPWAWASPEEQARFRAAMAEVTWSVLGRVTGEVAPRPERKRIVFTSSVKGVAWITQNHLGFNPAGATFDEVLETAKVDGIAAVLGGTRVHDYLLEIGRIDEIRLSIEPVRFGEGLPLFTGVPWIGVDTHLKHHGLVRAGEDEVLNDAGTVERIYRKIADA